jgi:hypothetical protein
MPKLQWEEMNRLEQNILKGRRCSLESSSSQPRFCLKVCLLTAEQSHNGVARSWHCIPGAIIVGSTSSVYRRDTGGWDNYRCWKGFGGRVYDCCQ